jgi:N-acetylglucosaminyldiphosphoundecaprenol N-acetyl-beta-D-mannosaminyltransferase
MKIENFEEVRLLQIRFHKIIVNALINYILKAAQSSQKTIVGNVNVQAMNIAHKMSWYRDFLNNADIVFCDGFGVLLGAKLLGYSVGAEHRMTGPDYIEDLVLACERQNVSVFLLAGKPGVVDKAISKFLAVAPNLKIQGHHGYFEKSGEENDFVIQKINDFKPGLLYVGFGMPLQERWILDNLNRIEARVFMPMGACLDFYTGTVYRGPRWMTGRGLEWLTRLLVEPQRLWERYIIGNPLFFYRVFEQWISQGMTTKV